MLLFASLEAAISASGAPALEIGEITGAHYTIAIPAPETRWNGNLLLIAHGYRPESAPLVADLLPDQRAYSTLLEGGWIVAKTSYRRNGIIITDAISDLDNLYLKIRDLYGSPKKVIVKGDSMGGTIATTLAERGGDKYHGLIAIGAALDLREDNGSTGVSFTPKIPLLFMSNRSEIEGPKAYVRKVSETRSNGLTTPAIFRINRDGHVNVNQAERLFAVLTMSNWLDRGIQALPKPYLSAKPYDATHIPQPAPSTIVIDQDSRGLTAEVTEVSAIYGNVWLNLQPRDLETIGLNSGLWFQLTVKDKTYRVFYGKDFSSVERGQWVIFPNADGYFWLSRNWANAAQTGNLSLGDRVHLRRYDSASPPSG
jgi:pimeloyl-ACP methyl ester carboxylesterase